MTTAGPEATRSKEAAPEAPDEGASRCAILETDAASGAGFGRAEGDDIIVVVGAAATGGAGVGAPEPAEAFEAPTGADSVGGATMIVVAVVVAADGAALEEGSDVSGVAANDGATPGAEEVVA